MAAKKRARSPASPAGLKVRILNWAKIKPEGGPDLVYLITGGAGFIGSHLAERLLERGAKVVILDNLSTGSMENIRHLKGSENLEYHLDGIENQQLLAELVDDADVIFHF